MPVKKPSFYERCLKTELEEFYKARLGKELPTGKDKLKKGDLVKRLEDVDRHPSKHGIQFRFLDLPAEMRNLIYGLVLPLGISESNNTPTQSRSKYAKSKTQILRVCKQVHSEAEGILYHDRDGEISIGSTVSFISYDPVIRWAREMSEPDQRRTFGQNSMLHNRQWSSKLLKFKTINVKVRNYSNPGSPSPERIELSRIAINQELYGLVSFLSTSTALKAVRVDFSESADLAAKPKVLESLLPLARLGSKVDVEFTGMSVQVKDDLLKEREAIKGGVENVLAEFIDTQVKVKELQKFQKLVGYKTSLVDEVDVMLKDMTKTLSIETMVDAEAEKKIAQATQRAKALLAGDFVKKVHRFAPRKTKEIMTEAEKKIKEVEKLQNKIKGIQQDAKDEMAAAGSTLK